MTENNTPTPTPKPGIFYLFQHKCPRCRRGDLYESPSIFTSKFMRMNEVCPVCGQHYDLEPGFYYGSSYISYMLTVAFSVSTFVAWWVIIGFSIRDNRIFYWLALNAVLLLLMQPYFMRLARTVWLSFFVKYDPYWQTKPAPRPERKNETHSNAW